MSKKKLIGTKNLTGIQKFNLQKALTSFQSEIDAFADALSAIPNNELVALLRFQNTQCGHCFRAK